MSQENVEVVRRLFEAMGEPHAVATMERLTADDVVYVEDPKWPGSDTYRGREAANECWGRYDELMGGEITASVLDVRDASDQIVAVVRVSGRTRESDVPFDHTWGYVCRVQEERVSYFRAYFTPAEALEAAGLRE